MITRSTLDPGSLPHRPAQQSVASSARPGDPGIQLPIAGALGPVADSPEGEGTLQRVGGDRRQRAPRRTTDESAVPPLVFSVPGRAEFDGPRPRLVARCKIFEKASFNI